MWNKCSIGTHIAESGLGKQGFLYQYEIVIKSNKSKPLNDFPSYTLLV